jgi:hypothetical protein
MAVYEFDAVIQRPTGVGTWMYVDIPFDVQVIFGKKGQVKVKGALNGQPYRGSAMPHGDGTHYLVAGGALRSAAGVDQGDRVHVIMEMDLEPRQVEMREDFATALERNPVAKTVFEKMAYSHQKAYVDWINEAKQQVTRQRRIEKSLLLLEDGKKVR